MSVLDAYEEEFGRSRAACAAVGANAEAAAVVRAGGWAPQRLCGVRDELFALVDADDARALLGRTPAESEIEKRGGSPKWGPWPSSGGVPSSPVSVRPAGRVGREGRGVRPAYHRVPRSGQCKSESAWTG
ncbi:hypothetical protein ACIRL2_40540 [Embleya sp. NPDC127516]|uniref:hypothetical protein n=1 Tax=Embleya sp. NPDC127516 TaxID=3363990 RepID=UPI0038286E72